jgi:hypothetical protein
VLERDGVGERDVVLAVLDEGCGGEIIFCELDGDGVKRVLRFLLYVHYSIWDL